MTSLCGWHWVHVVPYKCFTFPRSWSWSRNKRLSKKTFMWLCHHSKEIIIFYNFKAFVAVLPNSFKRFWLSKKWVGVKKSGSFYLALQLFYSTYIPYISFLHFLLVSAKRTQCVMNIINSIKTFIKLQRCCKGGIDIITTPDTVNLSSFWMPLHKSSSACRAARAVPTCYNY